MADVLAGVLDQYRHASVLSKLKAGPRQPVLTQFGLANLEQLYQCEELAFELWKCGATKRIVSKGAQLVVDHFDAECFYDNRSDELDFLVTNYDDRPSPFIASATASVFQRSPDRDHYDGLILLAQYNVERQTAGTYSGVLESLNLSFLAGATLNFNWLPFDAKSYVASH
jgi:hypothetical protein